jgi:hybrid cluster-associated redox disulfide protein
MLSPQTLLADLLDHSPQMAGLLLELRLDCVGCSMNKFCTLEELCNAYELDLESVLSKVQERLTNAKNRQEN